MWVIWRYRKFVAAFITLRTTADLLRGQDILAHERAQGLRNNDGAVSLLVVFQNGNEPAGSRQRAVQGSCDLGLAVLVAVAVDRRRAWKVVQFEVEVSSR